MYTPSFAIKLDKWTTLKDGTHPIVLQIIYQKKNKSVKSSVRLKMSSTLEDWNDKDERFSRKRYQSKILNEDLDEKEDKARDIYHEEFRKKEFDFKRFTELFRGKEQGSNVLVFLDALIDDILTKKKKYVKKKTLSVGTAKAFTYLRGALLNYAPNPQELTFEEITEEWCENFERRLLGGRCNEGGASAYFRSLKSLYGYAVTNHIVDQKFYPFKGRYNMIGYTFSHLKSRKIKITLSKEEIEKLYLHNAKDEAYRLAIDLFIFSYLLFGCNMEDIARFTEENIKQDGQFYTIGFYRKKTINSSGKYLELPLMPLALEIINRYKGKGKYLFPVLKDEMEGDSLEIKKFLENYLYSLQKRLTRAAKKEGIEKKITFYTARYSVGSIAKRAGANDELMADGYGHNSIKTTKIYTGSFLSRELIGLFKLIEFDTPKTS